MKNIILKKIGLVLLAVIMVLTTCSCGGSGGSLPKIEISKEDAKYFGKYDKPVKLTYFAISNGDYPEGESAKDNLWVRFCKEYLNIELECVNSFNETDMYTQIQLAASTDSLPDFFWHYDTSQLMSFYESGALADLTSVIDEYASDTFKEVIGFNDGSLYDPMNIDGKQIGIPLPVDMLDFVPLVYIRKDWMDNLGLKAPNSLQDVIDIATAFVQKDPDGNGKNDTLGIPMEGPGGFGEATWKLFFNANGAYYDQWIEKDGKLVYSGIQPEVRKALQMMVEAKKNGLFSEDDTTTLEEKLNNGLYGVLPGVFHNPSNIMKGNYTNFGAEWNVYALPANTVEVQPSAARYAVVSADCKNPEAIVKIMNAKLECSVDGAYSDWYEQIYCDEKYQGGGMMCAIPRHFEDSMTNYNRYLNVTKAIKEGTGDTLLGSEKEIYDALNGDKETYEYWEKNLMYLKVMPEVEKMIDKFHYSAFTGASTESMVSKGSQLHLLKQNAYLKIIDGKQDISYFDTFVENWLNKGGSAITKEVNEWYAANK